MNAAIRDICEQNTALRRRYFEKYGQYPVIYTPDPNHITLYDLDVLREQNQLFSSML